MSALSQEEMHVFDKVISDELSYDVIFEDHIALAYRDINLARKGDF